MKYTVIFEKSPNNYAAFSPDIPGCVSTADSPEEMRLMIREAIEFHFECLELDGELVPTPSAWTDTVILAGRKYVVVYENDSEQFVSYVPDFLPECEVTASSAEEVQRKLHQTASSFYWLKKQNGEPLPEPSAWAETMEIPHPSEVPA